MENPSLIYLPKPQTLFRHRAARFRQLAQTQSALAGYLELMAGLAEIQHNLIERTASALPGNQAGASCEQRSARLTSLPSNVHAWPRHPVWREGLRCIAERLTQADRARGPSLPGNQADGPGLVAILQHIRQAQDETMEAWADALLAGESESMEPGLAPFVAAAMQMQWTVQAARLEVETINQVGLATALSLPDNQAYLCPVCGSLPVAGLLQTGGAVQGLRYMCCGLCASQWNRTRIQCIYCGSSRHVAYFGIDGAGGAIKAEACGDCMSYVKLLDREKDALLEPFADDLASLALDILLAEEGYRRLGFNPLLIPGPM